MSIVEMKVPNIGESVKEVTLSTWLKQDGAYVKLDEPVCEFESDKATLEFPAEAAGILSHVASEGDDLEIGALVARIDTSAEAPVEEEKIVKTEVKAEKIEDAPTPDRPKDKPVPSYASGHPSPAAAKILAEKDIQPKEIEGTGKGGRITKEDASKATKRIDTAVSGEVKKEKIGGTTGSRQERREK